MGRGSVPNERYKTVQILELRRLHKNQDFVLRPARSLRSVGSEKVKKGDVIV